MLGIPKKVANRIRTETKKYQKHLKDALSRDVNESDTVTLITDILSDVFGWDKYTNLTSEYAIRKRFCDIAIKPDNSDNVWMIVEVKAIGLPLKDGHIQQAINYAANEGVEWVLLCNGIYWKLFKVFFVKPINYELFAEFDLSSMSLHSSKDIDLLFGLCKESIKKQALQLIFEEAQLTNKYLLAALILSDSTLSILKKEIRKINRNIKVDIEELRDVIIRDVIKREVTESDQLSQAQKIANKATRSRSNPHRTSVQNEQIPATVRGDFEPGRMS